MVALVLLGLRVPREQPELRVRPERLLPELPATPEQLAQPEPERRVPPEQPEQPAQPVQQQLFSARRLPNPSKARTSPSP